jgi:hypothetical protein
MGCDLTIKMPLCILYKYLPVKQKKIPTREYLAVDWGEIEVGRKITVDASHMRWLEGGSSMVGSFDMGASNKRRQKKEEKKSRTDKRMRKREVGA